MRIRLVLVVLFALLVAVQSVAQQFPPAQIVSDEGGPVAITGVVTYTNPFFTSGVASPVVILEDQAGFVDRNEYYIFPSASQVLGQITSDFYTSPFSYSIALPIEPQGTLRDVDNDGETDSGVMIYAVAYWNNVWGDPFLEERDLSGGGWSSAYASTRVSEDPENRLEIIGGSYLIYVPESGQGFPSGFGADGLLFTEDDPIVEAPVGYSVVNLDSEPFTFDRRREQVIDLIEPEGAALVDYANLSYTEAFDAMVEKLRNEYAFSEYKGLDWDAVVKKYRARFEEADAAGDTQLYLDTLADIIWSFPDGHVSVRPFNLFVDRVRTAVEGGIGLAIRETDDRRSFVVFTSSNGPAANAGIQVGAEILSLNGRPIAEAITRANPISETFSTTINRRLAQARYVTRFPMSTGSASVEYRNPGDATVQTTVLNVVQEFDSFFYSPTPGFTGYELPLDFKLLDSGVAYTKIYSFNDNDLLTIQLWERLIRTVNDQGALGLVIDMRENGGGSGFLADQMAAYFFNDPLVVGQRGYYSEETGEFIFDPRSVQRFYLPAEDLRFEGPVAVLVGPDCASACERFSYDLTLQGRATIVGSYPTAGLGGSVDDFMMPEGVTVRFTAGRSLDENGNIHIEGLGVAPTLRIPVTEQSLFSSVDQILEAGVNAVLGQ
ncbi:MAG: PDZ domain-containing protein [Anaerolineae bacterium]|nr:PDZ domain-containing protein [Anaerolineae bacterium]